MRCDDCMVAGSHFDQCGERGTTLGLLFLRHTDIFFFEYPPVPEREVRNADGTPRYVVVTAQ